MQRLSLRFKTITVVLTLLVAAAVSYGEPNAVEVTGFGECADCQQNNIQHSHALKGLKVTIDCKLPNGEVIKTKGTGELDEEGKFRVDIPKELVKDGKLKEECYAQLHSASNTPCPAYNGIESSKLASFSKTFDGKHTFNPVGKIKFSSLTCTSAFLWPHYKYPPLTIPKKTFPKIWKKPCPTTAPIYKKPLPPPVPVYKKPLPPPVPVYVKPLPPPVPVYKKPLPPPVPVYEKPLPPPVPIIKKPCPPVYKKKPITLPPIQKLPPFSKKKPCPIPKLPFPKFPSHPLLKKPSWPTYPPHH